SILTAISLVLILASLVCLCGCKTGELSQVSKALGVNVSGGTLETKKDTHGGFLGDGATYYRISFEDDSCLNEIRKSSEWSSLPLTEDLQECLTGHSTLWGDLPIPEITNGYYCFIDRHSEATDRKDDTDLHSRASYNYTLALYDADTDTMYYLRIDT
ncbi:MAG: hypothetical protein MJ102_09845, partial [Clostridia bacterium]|nr:hypothetical protein [Clostridia bacterium]